MRVLVTGGAGRFGTHVVERLALRGHHVIVADMLQHAAVPGTYERLDVADAAAVAACCRAHRVDVVVHLAAVRAVAANADPAAALRVNVGGTIAVLEAARELDLQRVVLASSVSLLAPLEPPYSAPDYAPVPETYPRMPRAAVRVYAASKIMCEELARHYHDAHGVEFAALRFASVLDPRGDQREVALAFKFVIDEVVAGRAVRLPSGADAVVDLIHVDDLADGVVAATEADGPLADVYNIGSGGAASLAEVARVVAQVVPDADIEIGPGGLPPEFHDSFYGRLDIAKAGRDLGYRPSHDLESTIRRYVAARSAAAAAAS